MSSDADKPRPVRRRSPKGLAQRVGGDDFRDAVKKVEAKAKGSSTLREYEANDGPMRRSRNQYTKRAASVQAEAAPQPGAQPENPGAIHGGRNKNGTFARGVSGNTAGKPKGTLHKATRAILEMMEGEAEAITRKAIDLALAGDSVAMRLVMERLVSPVRERPISFQLPAIRSAQDVVEATNSIAAAVAAGEMTSGDAANLGALVSSVGRAIELSEIEKRLAAVESYQSTGAPK